MASTAQDIMRRYGIDQAFAASIESLGNDLGVDPMYLANTMYAESRLNPSIENEAGSGAIGLIQFMPETAENLGTTTDELSRMTPIEQMEYVRKYFSADNLGAGRLRDLRNDPSQHNVNMAVFLPSMIGKPLDTQIPQKYWRQNGSIRTPGDYTRSAEKRVNEYIQSNPVDTQTDEMLSQEQPEDSFRPENDSVPSDTGTPTSDQNEEALEVDDTLISEHEEKIRRGEAPRGSKPTEEGGYYTEGKYGFKTNPEGEVVADLGVNSLENVVTSIGERLRTILGNNENSEALELNEGGLVESAREGIYSLGSRGAARELRDTVAKELGVYETSEEARSIANKYGFNGKQTDALRHILGAGLLKYIDRDFTQPLLQGTEVLDKLQVYAQKIMDPDAENIYNKSYYDQSIEEANRDIVNYQVGAALAKQYDTKEDFIKSAVKLVKDLGEGKTPVVVDKMPTRFGVVDRELTPQLSTGVVYNPDELKRKGVIYDPESDAMVSSRTVLSPPIPKPRPKNLKKAEGGSVEKEVEFGKEDDDDVPDPPPGATPEEVADNIPAYLSTGEYVLPANVVRYIGLKNIADMHRMALAELQQMEDLDIIENVDENGYVEEDDDETEYMKPEGVVEIVVAEHHPKGLMAMGFAEGGPVEAMVYVPGVGFVPQTEAATQPVKTEEESTSVSQLKESGEDTQADIAQQEEETEKISAEEAKSRAEKGLLGTGLISGLAAGVTSAISAEQALSSAGVSRDQSGNTTFGSAQTGPLGPSKASTIAGLMSNPGVDDAVKDHMSTSLSDEQMAEVLDSVEAGFDKQAEQEAEVGLDAFGGAGAPVGGEAESESESESGSGTGSEAAQGGGGADTAGLKKGGYVTKKGIMNRPY